MNKLYRRLMEEVGAQRFENCMASLLWLNMRKCSMSSLQWTPIQGFLSGTGRALSVRAALAWVGTAANKRLQ